MMRSFPAEGRYVPKCKKGLNYYHFKGIKLRKHKRKANLKTWLSTFNSFALSQPSLETFLRFFIVIPERQVVWTDDFAERTFHAPF